MIADQYHPRYTRPGAPSSTTTSTRIAPLHAHPFDDDETAIAEIVGILHRARNRGEDVTRDLLANEGLTPAQITLHWPTAIARFKTDLRQRGVEQ